MSTLPDLDIVTFSPELPRDLYQMADAIQAAHTHTLSARGLALAVMIDFLYAFVEERIDENKLFEALESFCEEIFIPEVKHDYQH